MLVKHHMFTTAKSIMEKQAASVNAIKINVLLRHGWELECDQRYFFYKSWTSKRTEETKDLTLLGTIRKINQSKKGKIVILLSTMHETGEICENDQNKPQILIDYNNTKSGVDTMGKLVRTYTAKRQTRIWPVTVLLSLERLYYLVSLK